MSRWFARVCTTGSCANSAPLVTRGYPAVRVPLQWSLRARDYSASRGSPMADSLRLRPRSRSTPPSHRFSGVPARSGDEVGVGVALGVGRGAGESPATFFSPPPSSLQPMYLLPLNLPLPATARRLETFGLTATRGGVSSPPFACPSRLIFSIV